jgi:segregation and condensation protein A
VQEEPLKPIYVKAKASRSEDDARVGGDTDDDARSDSAAVEPSVFVAGST